MGACTLGWNMLRQDDIMWEGEVEIKWKEGISTTRDRANNMHEVSDTIIARAATES